MGNDLTSDDGLAPMQQGKGKTSKRMNKLPLILFGGFVAAALLYISYGINKTSPTQLSEEEKIALQMKNEQEKRSNAQQADPTRSLDFSGEGVLSQEKQQEMQKMMTGEGTVVINNTVEDPRVKEMEQTMNALKMELERLKTEKKQVPAQIQAQSNLDQEKKKLENEIKQLKRQSFIRALTTTSKASGNASGHAEMQKALEGNSIGNNSLVAGQSNAAQSNLNAQRARLSSESERVRKLIESTQKRLDALNGTGTTVLGSGGSGGGQTGLTAPTVASLNGGSSAAANSSRNVRNGRGSIQSYYVGQDDDYTGWSHNGTWDLNQEMEVPASSYIVRAGMVIPATLISGVNSDISGTIIGQVSQNVYDTATGKYLLIPQGTRLIGAYGSGASYGQERVLIAWQRLVFPDNKTLDLTSMPGTDISGFSGFQDEVDNHWWRLISGAFLMSGITAAVSVATSDNNKNSSNNSTSNKTSMSEEMRVALATQFGQVVSQVIQRELNVAPTIRVRPGYRFNVMVAKDLTFGKPYQSFDYVSYDN